MRRGPAIFLVGMLGERASLVELLEEVVARQALRSLERVIVLQEGKGHHEVRQTLAARGVRDGGDVLDELGSIQEARDRRPLLGLLVDHHGGAYAAIRMAAAGERAPLRFGARNEVREATEGAGKGDWEQVAGGFAFAHLLATALGTMREGPARVEAVVA